MSNQSLQIKKLYEEGNTPEQIAMMLGYEVPDVLIVLNSLGLFKFKSDPSIVQAQQDTTVNPESVVEGQDVYKQYEHQVKMKLLQLALDEDPNSKGVQAKVAMYINEEITGRNEKRANKTHGGAAKIINIDKLLMHVSSTRQRLNDIPLEEGQLILNA